jgi:kinesin family protein C2/C3
MRAEQRGLKTQARSILKDFESNFGDAALLIASAIDGTTRTLEIKLLDERDQRKRLHNTVLELKGNVRVFVRPRPLRAEELNDGCKSIIGEIGDDGMSLDVLQPGVAGGTKRMLFDHVFRTDCTQAEVFTETAAIVTSVLDGYNACVFAYGQTGSGKTHTMEGTGAERGVNYRAIEQLFAEMSKRDAMSYSLSLSLVEVYNENVRDLIVVDGKSLTIREGTDGFFVPDATIKRASSMKDVLAIFQAAAKNRATSATNMNECAP